MSPTLIPPPSRRPVLQGIVKKDIDGCRQLRDLVFAVIGAVMGREAQDSAGNFEGTQCSGAGAGAGTETAAGKGEGGRPQGRRKTRGRKAPDDVYVWRNTERPRPGISNAARCGARGGPMGLNDEGM